MPFWINILFYYTSLQFLHQSNQIHSKILESLTINNQNQRSKSRLLINQKIEECIGIPSKSINSWQDYRNRTRFQRRLNLFAHLDNDVRIAATNITNGEVNAALDANSEQTQKIFHQRRLLLLSWTWRIWHFHCSPSLLITTRPTIHIFFKKIFFKTKQNIFINNK